MTNNALTHFIERAFAIGCVALAVIILGALIGVLLLWVFKK